MRSARWFVLVGALVCAACAADTPVAPDVPRPVAGRPTTLELNASAMVGANAGKASIALRVLDAYSTPIAGVSIGVETTAGSITPSMVVSDENGRGSGILVAPVGTAKVTANVVGQNLTTSTIVSIQATPPAPPDPQPGPTPPTPSPDPVPPLTVTILVSPQPAGQATGFSLATQAITSVTWDFGDGSGATTSTAFTSHVYGTSGSYPISVIVQDARGRTASAAATATIAAPPATPPPGVTTLSLILSCTPVAHPGSTPCNVNVTDQTGAVVTSQITRVYWEWGDGTWLDLPGPGAPPGPSGATSSHTYNQAGSYVVGATVFAGGASAITSRTVVIP